MPGCFLAVGTIREWLNQLHQEQQRCERCFPHPPLIYIGCRMSTTGERFERAVAIMERLRAPGGCPWDREQTFDSIKPYTLEETYEVLEAIDNRDWDELDRRAWRLAAAGALLCRDGEGAEHVLDRRCARPLVDQAGRSASACVWRREGGHLGEVLRNWEALKVEERKKRQARSGEERGRIDKRSRFLRASLRRCRH